MESNSIEASALSHKEAAEALGALATYFTLESHDFSGDPKRLKEIYKLRYEIYCLECEFLKAARYPDEMEIDGYDSRSVHFSANNSKGEVAGTARLVMPVEDDPFPFFEHCAPFPDFDPPNMVESGEVSRLAVRREYRRRAGDSLAGVNKKHFAGIAASDEAPTGEKRVNAPLLVLGLYRQMYRFSCERGIRYWYAAMEKGLARVLKIYGFEFVPIGPEHDYYGPVTPYLGDLRMLESQLEEKNPALLWWFKSGP